MSMDFSRSRVDQENSERHDHKTERRSILTEEGLAVNLTQFPEFFDLEVNPVAHERLVGAVGTHRG
jgi:hypothetical protein